MSTIPEVRLWRNAKNATIEDTYVRLTIFYPFPDGAISRQPSVSFGPISTRRIPSRKELKQILNAKSRLSKSMEKSKSCLKDTKNSTCSAHHSRKRRREQTESEHSLSPHRKRRRKDSSDAGKAETETTNGSCFRKVLPPRTSVRQYRKRHRHGGHKY